LFYVLTGPLSLLEHLNGHQPLNHNSNIHPDSILVNMPGDEIPQFVFHALLTNPQIAYTKEGVAI